MSGYDQLVRYLAREEIEARAFAWRDFFSNRDAWVVDIPQILEVELPKLLPAFAVRVRTAVAMPNEEAVTFHSVPAIDFREDVYDRLCKGGGRERFTAAHELGHLFLHTGESRPRAVSPLRSATIPASRSSERQANAFAASFLMPESIVRQFATPTDLSSGCKVSVAAADFRMRELGLWPKGRTPPPEFDELLSRLKDLQKSTKIALPCSLGVRNRRFHTVDHSRHSSWVELLGRPNFRHPEARHHQHRRS
jgi:hypothetical protein